MPGLALATIAAIGLQLHPAIAASPGDDTAMSVSVVRATRRCFTDRLPASGVLVASHEIELRPDRDGLVVSDLLVEPGDTVVQGQVLARLISPQAPTQAIEMKAPASGLVLAAGAIVGAYTSPGAKDPLFRIAADGAVELQAEIVATSLPRLRREMLARIHVVGLGDLDGRLLSIGDGVDARTQLGTVRLSVADKRLRVGVFGRAEIDAGQDCGLSIPSGALLFGPDGPVVGIVQSDRVVMRRVTTGLVDGATIEIRDGLTENDSVIARAGPFLRDGDRVRPMPEAK